MSIDNLKLIATRCIRSKLSPVLLALASIVLASIILPAGPGTGSADPAADAQEAYRSLMDEMGETADDRLAATQGILDLPDSSTVAGRPGRLNRNLFVSARGTISRMYQAPASSAGERPRSLPSLTGVFIDGFSKHAYIAGIAATEGDTVMGYTVVEIAPSWVVVERDGVKHRLLLGGNP